MMDSSFSNVDETTITKKENEPSGDGAMLMDLSVPSTVLKNKDAAVAMPKLNEEDCIPHLPTATSVSSETGGKIRADNSMFSDNKNFESTVKSTLEKPMANEPAKVLKVAEIKVGLQGNNATVAAEVVAKSNETSAAPPKVAPVDKSKAVERSNTESASKDTDNKSSDPSLTKSKEALALLDSTIDKKTKISPPPGSSAALEDKKVKMEKIEHQEQQQKLPQVPPMVLSLASRSRSSSHSSKSSKHTSPAPSPGPKPKHRTKRPPPNKNVAQIYDGRNDFYCWICHKDGQVLCCELCPRVFHTKCLSMKKAPEGDWYCPVCERITHAECEETQSKIMAALTTKQLSEHLKFALKRLEIAGSEPFREPVNTELFKDYLEYVFNPMDFKTLEENRRNCKYGSTEAFMADVKWILHNCIVYNGHTKLSQLAKQIVKTAEFEMTEIEVCPECYLNAGNNRPSWFCEPCTEPHILIWAKLQGFPHWPAKALRIENGSVDARFFGQHDRAWIPESNCYWYSKELPFPVKNKKKAGAKGGLDNAIAEAQLYIDNVKAKFGKFEYAPLRKPITENTSGAARYSGGDLSGQGSNQEYSDNDSLKDYTEEPGKSLAAQIKSLTQHSTDYSTAILPPKKKSKIVTTSGAHPKKLASMKHNPMLGKTIESATASLLTSMEGGIDDLESDDSESSDTSESLADMASSKGTSPDGKGVEKNGSTKKGRNISSDSDSELIIDMPDDDQEKSSKHTPIMLSKYSNNARAKKKTAATAVAAAAADDNKPVRLVIKDGVSSSGGGGGGGMKRKHTNDETNGGSAKVRKSSENNNEVVTTRPKAVFEKSFLKKKTVTDATATAGKTGNRTEKNIGDKSKTKREASGANPTPTQSSNSTTTSTGINKKRGGAAPSSEKPYLKNTAKMLSHKMSNKKPEKRGAVVAEKDKSQETFSKRLQSFTIPKHKSNTSTRDEDSNAVVATGKTNSDVSSSSSSRNLNSHHSSTDTSATSSSSGTNKNSILQKYNERMTSFMRQMLMDVYEDANKCSANDNNRATLLIQQQLQSVKSKEQEQLKKMSHLQTKIERLSWEHSQAIAELQHNNDLRVAEVRQSFENDKKQHVDDLRRKMENEKKKAVDETKRKQWCNNCGKEAVLYCCWNTTYCDYPCQEIHWLKHMTTCAQRENDASVGELSAQDATEEATTDTTAAGKDEAHEMSSLVESDDEAMVIDEDVTIPMPKVTSSNKSYTPAAAADKPSIASKEPTLPSYVPNPIQQPKPKSILSKKSSFDKPSFNPTTIGLSTSSPLQRPLTGILKKQTPIEPPTPATAASSLINKSTTLVDSFFSKSQVSKRPAYVPATLPPSLTVERNTAAAASYLTSTPLLTKRTTLGNVDSTSTTTSKLPFDVASITSTTTPTEFSLASNHSAITTATSSLMSRPLKARVLTATGAIQDAEQRQTTSVPSYALPIITDVASKTSASPYYLIRPPLPSTTTDSTISKFISSSSGFALSKKKDADKVARGHDDDDVDVDLSSFHPPIVGGDSLPADETAADDEEEEEPISPMNLNTTHDMFSTSAPYAPYDPTSADNTSTKKTTDDVDLSAAFEPVLLGGATKDMTSSSTPSSTR